MKRQEAKTIAQRIYADLRKDHSKKDVSHVLKAMQREMRRDKEKE